MEALEELLKSLKKREANKSLEEANAQLQEILQLRDAVVAFEKESLTKIVPATFAKTQKFITDAKNDLKKLESDAAAFIKKTVDPLISDAKSFGNKAKESVFHDRYPECLDAIAKAREMIAKLSAAPYNTHPSVTAFLPDFIKLIDNYEREVGEKQLKKLVTTKISDAKTFGTRAKENVFHNKYQESLDASAKAREAIAALSEEPYKSHPLVTAFLPDFIKQIDDYERQVSDKILEKVVIEKVNEAKTNGSKAKDMLFHNKYQESLDASAKARESIALLSEAPYSTHSKVTSFLPDFIKQIDQYETECGEKMFGKVVSDKISEAKSQGTKAKEFHYHSRYEEALEAVAKAREIIADLQSTFGSHKTVVEFLPAFVAQIDGYEKQCGEAMYSKVVNDKIREADRFGDTAKDMHYHSRYQESLDAIAKARERVDELSNPPFATFESVVKFLPEFIKKLDDLETKCGEAMFGKVVGDKIREADRFGTTAKDMHYHSRYEEALEAVAKARELINELSQTPYGTFKSVIEFLPEFTKKIDEYEKLCGEAMFSKVANDKIREADRFGTTAKDMHYHSRYEESLTAVATARERVNELAQAPYVNLDAVKEFLNKFVKQIDEIETKCGEAMFARLANDKIRQAERFGTTAKDMHYHSRYEESLEGVAKAREAIAELQEAPWNSLESVVKFLPEFITKIDEYERLCGEALFNKVVDEKIRAAKTHGTTAKDMHYHSRHQESLDAVAKAREVIAELNDAPYNSLEATKTFLAEFVKQIDDYERQCGEALFSKVVDEKIRAAKTHSTTAKDMHYHSRYQESLDAVVKAREIISELKDAPYNSLKSTQEFLPEFEKQINEYERQCGEAMFGKVVGDKIRAVKSLVTAAEENHFHSKHQEALTSIAKARESIAELDEAPYKYLDATIVYLKEVKPALDALEGKIGEVLFGKVVDEKIRAAKTQLDSANNFHFHSRNSEALTSIAKTREVLAELNEAPYNNLPTTITYLKETNAALDALESKVGEAMFGKVVYDKVQVGKTHVNNAQQFVYHSRHEDALKELAKAFENLDELENPPFNTLPLVKTYVQETRTTLASLEQSIGAALDGKAGAGETKAVKSAVPNAPGFPDGPLAATVGPWVVHISANLKGVQAQSATPPKTRSFIIQWTSLSTTINSEWKKAVNALIRDTEVAENVSIKAHYEAPGYISGKFKYCREQIEKAEKQVQELPDSDKDDVKQQLVDQLKTAKANIDENIAREETVQEFVHTLTKAYMLYHRIISESKQPIRSRNILKFVEETKSEWHSLNMKFPNIPPFQEKIDELLKEQEAFGKVIMILEIIEVTIKAVKHDSPIHTQEEVLEGLKKLEKWPVAHRAAIRRLNKIWDSSFRFRRIDWKDEYTPVWPIPTAPTDLWQPSEEDVGIPDYDMVRPGTPAQSGLPFAKRPDLAQKDPIFVEHTLPYAGQIVFAAEDIPRYIRNKDALKNKFTLSDAISARAVWPTSLANYAIGKKKTDGSPVYPVDKLLAEAHLAPRVMISLLLKIDGKLVFEKYAYQDTFAFFTADSDMYYTEQTLEWDILGAPNKPANLYTIWGLMPRMLYGQLLRAGPGTHKVEMSLHYNIHDNFVDHQNRRDGPTNIETLTSHPLAEGSFEVVVPEGAKIPDTFGKSQVEDVPLKDIKLYYRTRAPIGPEHVLWCQEVEGWRIHIDAKEVIEYDEHTKQLIKIKIPAKYGKTYAVITYKSPEEKWRQEAAAYSTIVVVSGPLSNWSQGVETILEIRQGATFEVDFLPDNLIAAIPQRCEAKFRNV